MRNFVALFLVLAACGKPPNLANLCATKGSTYFAHYVEANNGTCGTVPDAIVNIKADGTIPGDPPVCDSNEQDGCTARNTNCKTSSKGTDCSLTTSVTFDSDGAKAAGLLTLSCTTGNSICASTYQVTMLRQ